MEPTEAARVCGETAALLALAMTRTTDPGDLDQLAQGQSAVATRLEPMEAARVCSEAAALLARAMTRTSDASALSRLAHGLGVLLNAFEPPEQVRRAAAVTGMVGALGGAGRSFLALAMSGAVVEPLPCRLSTQGLVDLLKMPTCIGEARRVILDYLASRYRRPFRDRWEFVEYAQQHLPDLDLTGPPTRPSR
jgi:hypothetical protein